MLCSRWTPQLRFADLAMEQPVTGVRGSTVLEASMTHVPRLPAAIVLFSTAAFSAETVLFRVIFGGHELAPGKVEATASAASGLQVVRPWVGVAVEQAGDSWRVEMELPAGETRLRATRSAAMLDKVVRHVMISNANGY